MIGEALKKAVLDIWEEMLYLVCFNIVWFISAVLILPFPFTTFSLFAIAYDIGQGKAIKLKHFGQHLRRTWREAGIWGGINLIILIVGALNLQFYAQFTAQWAYWLQIVTIGLLLWWCFLQLLMLALYPRLVEPSFRLALRNAVAILGLSPAATFALLTVVVGITALAVWQPPFGFLVAFGMLAVFTNRTVELVVKTELEEQP